MRFSTCVRQKALFSIYTLACLLLVSCGGDNIDTYQEPEPAPAIPGLRDRPNIVLVVSDDQRWDLMSARGHEHVTTPNLDAVTQSGAMMANAFVPVALCSPSRGALLTGRDVHKASAPRIVWRNNSFLQTQRTLAEDMQAAGYETAYIGKWHLGEGSKPKRGFDHWESFDWLGKFFDPSIWINGQEEQFGGFVDDILAERAAHAIRRNESSDKPLFLIVGLKEPHLHFEHPPRHANAFADSTIARPDTYYEDFAESGKVQAIWDWLGMDNFHCGLNCFDYSWDKYIKSHYRAILGLDDAIGAIRGTINEGEHADNTLFIYTSDNGYSLGDHGLTEKHFVYEEPIRVPLLVDAPGNLDAGTVHPELVSVIDIAPTVLDYANIAVPDVMTGNSLRPLLEKSAIASNVDTENLAVANWRDQLFFMYEKAQAAVRTSDFKLIKSLTEENHYELYDLQNDPKETRTVYADPAYTEARRDMRRRLKSIIEENQWSQRKSYPVREVLVSDLVSTTDADELAVSLSQQLQGVDTPFTGGEIAANGRVLNFTEMRVGTDKFPDRFPLKQDPLLTEGQSRLVILPLHLITDWDPFIEVKIRRRTHAKMYHAGEVLFDTTGERLPLDAANPPLYIGENYVVLRFDDSGAMDVKIEIESPEDTVSLSVEDNRLLGNMPGRFYAYRSWQPHNDVNIDAREEGLWVSSTGVDTQIQTQNVYFDEPVEVSIQYSSDSEIAANLYWKNEYGAYSAEQKVDFQFVAGEQQTATVAINPGVSVDMIRLDLASPQNSILLKSITVHNQQGKQIHSWNFTANPL